MVIGKLASVLFGFREIQKIQMTQKYESTKIQKYKMCQAIYSPSSQLNKIAAGQLQPILFGFREMQKIQMTQTYESMKIKKIQKFTAPSLS